MLFLSIYCYIADPAGASYLNHNPGAGWAGRRGTGGKKDQ